MKPPKILVFRGVRYQFRTRNPLEGISYYRTGEKKLIVTDEQLEDLPSQWGIAPTAKRGL